MLSPLKSRRVSMFNCSAAVMHIEIVEMYSHPLHPASGFNLRRASQRNNQPLTPVENEVVNEHRVGNVGS